MLRSFVYFCLFVLNVWMQCTSTFVFSSGYVLNGLCAQAIGAHNPKLAGNWLQLALGVCTCLCIPAIICYFFTENVIGFVTLQ